MSVRGMTGRCLCGEVRYRLAGDLVWSGYCHCDSCRRFTGAVVTNWLGIRDSDLILTAGSAAADGDWQP